jgi:glutaredoxin
VPSSAPPRVVVYSTPECHLCEEAFATLDSLRPQLGFDLRVVDITCDDQLHREYFERVPVVLVDGEEVCEYVVHEAAVRERLESRQ